MKCACSNRQKRLPYSAGAGEITALAHTRAMEKCRPGMFEYHLEGEIHHEFNRHGARYPSYNTIVGSGENGCILHYTENECELRDGDLVLIDAGCEYKGYAGDITRTFPVNGKFTQAQREIYDIVLESLETSPVPVSSGNFHSGSHW
ncbi:proline aminopeptidase II [Escherichia coli]|uniref:Xaa-Pro aminopeptidase n=1 Tax=Escherichia coli TaxID=562 RepID=A0A376WAE4_ECOLX|nr:proline aminopeptidase II [Escherichia coli]